VGKLRALQSVTVTPGWGADYVFCPECFPEMRIAESGLPYWRRRWMDATATWCQTHGASLVPIARLSSLAHRSLDSPEALFQSITEAHQEKSAAWIEQLAEDADELTRLLPAAPDVIVDNEPSQLYSSHGGALFLALLDQILLLILEIVAAEYDDAMLLATHLGVTSPESMGMHRLPRRIHCLRSPVLGQIRQLKQRTWLLGIAACIIAPNAATPNVKARTMEQREALRGWLWHRVDPWQLAKLVPIVIKAVSADLMLSWPAAQSWTRPTTAAGWFQRSADHGKGNSTASRLRW